MSDDNDIPIANETEADMAPPPPPKKSHYKSWSLWLVYFDAYGSTKVYVWGKGPAEAVEEAAAWAAENAPGVFYEVGEGRLKDAAEDLGISWPTDNEEDRMRVYEEAETDLWYTESGYIPSYEVHFDEIDMDTDEYRDVWGRSMRAIHAEGSLEVDLWDYFDRQGNAPEKHEGEDPDGDPEFFDIIIYDVDAADRAVFPELENKKKIAFIDYYDRSEKKSFVDVIDLKDARKYMMPKKKSRGFEFLN